MPTERADIIAQLQRDILLLQGLKPTLYNAAVDVGLGPVREAFADGIFPTGAVHELLSADAEHAAATTGFISSILGGLMQDGRAVIWISTARKIFPPALKSFGIEPDRIIFIDTANDKESLWVMEEALKCEGLAAVVGEIKDVSFTHSRRLQLAVEKSRVTGFIHRHQPRTVNTTTCVSRWLVSPLASGPEELLPGVGFPRWNIVLQRIRGGKPGSWQVEWSDGKLQSIHHRMATVPQRPMRKIS
ncbi:ImuA family protein [Chitinophaga vietnamensis]|uniref:ImuA family protein n=1 Tax=Chitinophaga vietnamensis TaxID=2593957 RepID=UPI0011788157|nr:Error-prone repair protein ImuA [Chitinophaga vietnamensis]